MICQNEHPVLVVGLCEARHSLRPLPEPPNLDTGALLKAGESEAAPTSIHGRLGRIFRELHCHGLYTKASLASFFAKTVHQFYTNFTSHTCALKINFPEIFFYDQAISKPELVSFLDPSCSFFSLAVTCSKLSRATPNWSSCRAEQHDSHQAF